MIACFLFVGGLVVGNTNILNLSNKKEASIYLDVNPSIEIQINKDEKVIECIALNSDGDKILENIALEGIEINTALYAIVGTMYANGCLNEETNSILVSVDSNNENEIVLLDQISNQINNVFSENEKMKCSIIAQKVESNNELDNKAKGYDISIGKMHLIEKIVCNSDLYTEDNMDELTKMSIHELDLIYQSLVVITDDEVVQGKPGGFVERDELMETILDNLEISINDIKLYYVIALYHHDENKERKMIYLITVELKGSNEKIKYIVDCLTGEILPDYIIEDWKDKIKDEGPFGGPKDFGPSSEGPSNKQFEDIA